MSKKVLFSLGLTGLLVSTLSFQGVQAEGGEQAIFSKLSEQRSADILTQPKESLVQSGTVTRATTTTYFMESESNNSFTSANAWSMANPAKGQMLPMYDDDFYKITLPRDGKLIIKGASNNDHIVLDFVATEKDWVESSKLVFLENESNWNSTTEVETQAYQAKAGTYYIAASDYDFYDDFDDNVATDFYTLTASFIDNVKPAIPTVNKVDSNDLAVTGKAEASSTITVKNGISTWTGKAATTGTFSVPIAVQKIGTKLTVTAKDSAGNVSSIATATVVDGIAPVKPTVNRVDNNDLVVTGKAEANSTVTVKKGTTVLKAVKATTTGTFSAAIPVQRAGTQLSITAKDATGNTSAAAVVTVADVIAPSKPIINRVDDNDLRVTGKAEAYSTISVKVGTTSIGTATTNSLGVYSAVIPAQRKGTTLSVRAKDKAGNTSAASTYIVVAH